MPVVLLFRGAISYTRRPYKKPRLVKPGPSGEVTLPLTTKGDRTIEVLRLFVAYFRGIDENTSSTGTVRASHGSSPCCRVGRLYDISRFWIADTKQITNKKQTNTKQTKTVFDVVRW